MGHPCRKQRVLYLDMESGDIGRRIKMHRLYREAEPPEDWLFATEPIRLPEELSDFLAYIQAEGVTFVVFDTARRCFTVKDENDNAEVYNRVVPTLDALKQAGVASLVLGHPPKNGATGARGARGAGGRGRREPVADDAPGRGRRPTTASSALRITKNRLLGLGHPPLYLRRVGGDRFERVEAEEANRAEPEAEEPVGRQEQCQATILDFLHGRPNGHATTGRSSRRRAKGSPESTAKRSHAALRDAATSSTRPATHTRRAGMSSRTRSAGRVQRARFT